MSVRLLGLETFTVSYPPVKIGNPGDISHAVTDKYFAAAIGRRQRTLGDEGQRRNINRPQDPIRVHRVKHLAFGAKPVMVPLLTVIVCSQSPVCRS